MVFHLPNLLDANAVSAMRSALARATWVDGRVTATGIAADAKSNLQLAEDDPLRTELGRAVLDALSRSSDFNAAALPSKVCPPGFNRYRVGDGYGTHIDTVIRAGAGTAGCLRCDFSATLFLSGPDEYDGGELVVQEGSAMHEAKLPSGSLFLYPSTTQHSVRPVTRGERVAAFFWVQSLVRDDDARRTLFELDDLASRVVRGMPDDSAGLELLALHNQLLRRWSAT